MAQAAYRTLPRDELHGRVKRALAGLAECRLCPRRCAVDRLASQWSACKTGRHAVVASWGPHHGEENPLRGWNGSGTIFFAHCNLRCVFCQNYDISQSMNPTQALPGNSPDEIASMMLRLQSMGCHNVNFVTPEHVVPQVLEALEVAVDGDLSLPIVYNTGAYDSAASIELLDGIVDIYMPDFKCWSAERARKYLAAEDYPEVARSVIKRMHDQVGPLVIDADGVAQRGVLLRHLVMPGALDETKSILSWIARELGPDTYVNLMAQYHPAGKVTANRYGEINRRLTMAEFQEACTMAADVGLRRLDGM